MTHRTGRRAAALTAVIGLTLAACGGGSDGDDAEETPATDAAEETADDAMEESDDAMEESDDAMDEEATDDGEGAETGGEDPPAPEPDADGFEPGDIRFRAVNLLDQPVDLYARTTGLVEAYLVQPGLAPGEVSEWIAPPQDGIFLVTVAGATDPTCVGSCEEFLAELSTFPDEGPARTVVLWGDEFDPSQAFELWELPTADALDAANKMEPPQADAHLAVVTAIALTDADFGIRASTDSTEGCAQAINMSASMLVGGTATPAFALSGGDTSITFYGQPDDDCSGEPVGGPVEVSGEPGGRSHVILSGSPGSIEAIVLPMESDGSVPASGGDASGGDAGGGGDRDLAVALMTEEVATEIGLPDDQAPCVAELLVDAIGADVLLDGDQLTDLDALGPAVEEQAGLALVESVDVCGVDPAIFGG